MAVWVIRAGDSGKDEYGEWFFDAGLLAIGFGQRRSVSEYATRDALRRYIQNDRNNKPSAPKATNAARQLWLFANEIEVGDMILTPRTRPDMLAAVGRVTGDYAFRPDLLAGGLHTRTVQWEAVDIQRKDFGDDYRPILGRRPTVSPLITPDAETHIDRVVRKHLGKD